jgi:metallo-beta-lactamase family protein
MSSWQAPNTLGRRLVEQEKVVRIYGEEHQVRAKVEVLSGFSGHADREGLLDFVRVMEKRPARTFIVHGEEESAASLADALRQELGLENVQIPQSLDSFVV